MWEQCGRRAGRIKTAYLPAKKPYQTRALDYRERPGRLACMRRQEGRRKSFDQKGRACLHEEEAETDRRVMSRLEQGREREGGGGREEGGQKVMRGPGL